MYSINNPPFCNANVVPLTDKLVISFFVCNTKWDTLVLVLMSVNYNIEVTWALNTQVICFKG